MLTVKEVKEALGAAVDQVSRKKDGTIIVRRGYFYRSITCEEFMLRLTELMNCYGLSFDVVVIYDHWAPFRGGDSINKNSHFAVVLKGRDNV
jgi:Lhr-like helicase